MKVAVDKKELKQFGVVVGGILSLIGLWLTYSKGVGWPVWLLGIGASLVSLGLLVPTALRWPHRGWMGLAHVLGYVNTRIILGIIFYGLITPMGLVMRLFGKDAMRRALVQDMESYRIARSARPPSHMRHQF